MRHNKIEYKEDGTEVIGEMCDGETFWDEGLEGYCCDKCHWDTSLK